MPRETIAEWRSTAQSWKNRCRSQEKYIERLGTDIEVRDKSIRILRWIAGGASAMAAVCLILCLLAVVGYMNKPQTLVATPQPVQPQQKLVAYTPDHIAACLRMENGRSRCSGVVISRGSQYGLVLSAAHCVTGRIGGECSWVRADGKSFNGKLLAYDRNLDLSLFQIAASDVPGVAPIHCSDPNSASKWEACGYTAGGGLKYKTVSKCKSGENHYHIRKGPFGGGDSGGAVFADGGLVGIISGCENDPSRTDNEVIYPGCTRKQMHDWVSAQKLDKNTYGSS